MILLVIRHGESEADLLNVYEGRANFKLTERGLRQAKAMAEYISNHYKVTRIYSSTLKRAVQTAYILSEKTGITVEWDQDLMEFNNGYLAGLSREEADKRFPEVKDLPIDQAVYGQESKIQFRNRAIGALNRIVSENEQDAVVAIVTHGGMINQLYGALFHTPIGEKPFLRSSDTGIHVWEITDKGSYVIKSNLIEHTKGI